MGAESIALTPKTIGALLAIVVGGSAGVQVGERAVDSALRTDTPGGTIAAIAEAVTEQADRTDRIVAELLRKDDETRKYIDQQDQVILSEIEGIEERLGRIEDRSLQRFTDIDEKLNLVVQQIQSIKTVEAP